MPKGKNAERSRSCSRGQCCGRHRSAVRFVQAASLQERERAKKDQSKTSCNFIKGLPQTIRKLHSEEEHIVYGVAFEC